MFMVVEDEWFEKVKVADEERKGFFEHKIVDDCQV